MNFFLFRSFYYNKKVNAATKQKKTKMKDSERKGEKERGNIIKHNEGGKQVSY